MNTRMTADEVAHALRKKYSGNEWAFMCQVRNGTGDVRQARYADAMAFGLWPSRGLEIQGFEIKVARGDWLKEKATPEKAEAIAQFCDRWWIAAPVGLVLSHELPAGWGLIEIEGSAAKVTKDAPKLEPKEPKRQFWMSVMRAFTEQVDVQAQIDQQVKIAVSDAEDKQRKFLNAMHEGAIKRANERVEQAEQRALEANRELSDVCQRLGVSRRDINTYPFGEVMHLLRHHTLAKGALTGLQIHTETLIKSLKQFGEALKEGSENGKSQGEAAE